MKRRDFIKDVRGMTVAQISGKISGSKKKLIELDQEKLLGKLKNIGEISTLRKEIAQLMTIRDEKITESLTKESNA